MKWVGFIGMIFVFCFDCVVADEMVEAPFFEVRSQNEENRAIDGVEFIIRKVDASNPSTFLTPEKTWDGNTMVAVRFVSQGEMGKVSLAEVPLEVGSYMLVQVSQPKGYAVLNQERELSLVKEEAGEVWFHGEKFTPENPPILKTNVLRKLPGNFETSPNEMATTSVPAGDTSGLKLETILFSIAIVFCLGGALSFIAGKVDK